MERTILMGEKEVKFKSSAATNLLYKRVFGEDILLKLAEYSKNIKEMQKANAEVKALQADETKPKEEILEAMNNYLNSEVFVKANEFQRDTLPQLAFIMWLEANEPAEKIFSKLNQEQYLFWLMTINQDELLDATSQVIDIWQSGAKNHSKPKN
jgi:hypothetical protein